MDRSLQIQDWLTEIFSKNKFEITPINGDASLRKYHRIKLNNKSYILMDSEHDSSIKQFIEVAEYLKNKGINSPKIIHKNINQNLLIIEDFGDNLYFNKLSDNNCDNLYTDAILALVKMQTAINPYELKLKSFDYNFIRKQLDIFSEWYLEKYLTINREPYKKSLDELAKYLTIIFQQQPQSFVHLDYHSKNLLVLEQQNPGILDFQDAMIGPTVYDLASLFQDAYIKWDEKQIKLWLSQYNNELPNDLKYQSSTELEKAFDIIGMQRHIKNLGVFARLNYKFNKPSYLKHIPMLLHYINQTIKKYPEIEKLNPIVFGLLKTTAKDNSLNI